MGYAIDLSKLSMEKYKDILKNQYLLPSRKILQQDVESSFQAILSCGISNIYELKSALATAKKLSMFAEKSGLPKEYLTILRREIGSIEPKTLLLKEFPGVDEETLESLAAAGLKSSKGYYDYYNSLKDKNEFTKIVPVSQEKARELFCLCDLVRINGVGAVAAKSFYDSAYKSVHDVASSTAEDMLIRVSAVNEIKHYYKTKLGIKDMQFCIDFAKIIVGVEKGVL
jgi:hypothetical protein